jgi:hypothetical protein
METFKQIVYRNDDTALMIVPTNEDIQIMPRFINELSDSQKQPFINLRDFCLTKTDTIMYVVYTTDVDRLDIQPIEGDVVYFVVNELDQSDKDIVDSALQECSNLLNN